MMILLQVMLSSCTELALLSSGTGIAVSQSAYAKAYSGADFLTVISTKKDIKTHAYESLNKKDKNE
jgi:hypothetical protein